MHRFFIVFYFIHVLQVCEATWRGEVSVGGGGEVRLTLPVGAECGGVAVLEHVHVTLDLTSGTRRGEFAVRLLSPTGTLSQLLAPRPLDNAVSGIAKHLHF
jgi:hypothetical protein